MRDLIVFGEDWGGLPSSTQHLVSEFTQYRKVLWINSIGLRQPRLSVYDIKRAAKKLLSAKKVCSRDKTLPENLTVINVKTLPAPKSLLARKLAAKVVAKQVKPWIKKLQLERPILWCSLPTAGDLVGQLGESAVVYYCGDDFGALAGVDHKTVLRHEQDLVKRSHLILTASEVLTQRINTPVTQVLPHGVNYDLFSKTQSKAADFNTHEAPVAGFYGSISQWIDLDLIHKVAEALPHWKFVFIGNADVNVDCLKKLDNVEFYGPRAHHELPGYAQYWTASLLPFKLNGQIRACNPLKLSEYMAVGKPIISTGFPAVKKYAPLVQVAETPEAFIAALEAAVNLNDIPSFKTALQSQVAHQSWEAKALQATQWIASI